MQSIEGKQVNINNKLHDDTAIDAYIAPYRAHVEEEMSAVLAYNPVALTKEKEVLNAGIGNFMADASYEMADAIFFSRTGQHIDFVLLNWGGIRSDLSAGDITTRSAYELMPFENKLVVLGLKGEKLLDFARYMAKGKKPHPLSKQIELTIDADSNIHDFTLHGKKIDPEATYYVATSDYLMNGGDGMTFFQNAESTYELDYLIRNILIDYFQKIDTLHARKDKRFSMMK
ncbi:MAG: 5'-nucleotidase [Capnocytophaga sp.]|nr:5'-nucleotidase [Capnocytophaga sp.]